MRIVKIVICMVICNAAFSQFVGTPYILKKIPDISLVGVTPIYADSLTPNPTNYSYILKGSIINYGTMPLLEYGFFYGKTFTSSIKIQATSMQQDTFSANLILTESSYESSFPNYYIWAYAKNSAGLVVDSSSSSNFFQVVPTLRSTTTKKIWMDRNLGALSISTVGYYYKWGVKLPIKTTSPTYYPSPSSNDNAWTGVDGINNPCPIGFRVPTITELNSETASGNVYTILKIKSPSGWYAIDNAYQSSGVNNPTAFWASNASGAGANFTRSFNGGGFASAGLDKRYSLNVRCIKN